MHFAFADQDCVVASRTIIKNLKHRFLREGLSWYLNRFLVDLHIPFAEFVQGRVCVLSVHHNDISTTSRRNHLQNKDQAHESKTIQMGVINKSVPALNPPHLH